MVVDGYFFTGRGPPGDRLPAASARGGWRLPRAQCRISSAIRWTIGPFAARRRRHVRATVGRSAGAGERL